MPASHARNARQSHGVTPDGHDLPLGQAVVGFARVAELALAQSGLSLTQYRILQHLERSNTIQSDLAFQLTVTKQSTTRLVDGLVERGFIARSVDPDDRRRVIHAITAKGRRALQRSNDIVERFLMAVLQDLDDDAAIEVARNGIRLFGVAAEASRERVRPDGIVPGPRTRRARALSTAARRHHPASRRGAS